MKQLLRIEEICMLGLGIVLVGMLPYRWWLFPALILLPDISILGYALSTKAGTHIYNLFHHKGLALLVFIIGFQFEWAVVMLIGVILFSHAALDRIFGYGLKYPDAFEHTHLVWIGKKKSK